MYNVIIKPCSATNLISTQNVRERNHDSVGTVLLCAKRLQVPKSNFNYFLMGQDIHHFSSLIMTLMNINPTVNNFHFVKVIFSFRTKTLNAFFSKQQNCTYNLLAPNPRNFVLRGGGDGYLHFCVIFVLRGGGDG